MTNGDLLRNLIKCWNQRDDSGFRTVIEEIIREERLKNHRLLAEDLERLLLNGSKTENKITTMWQSYEIPKDTERGFPLLDISNRSEDLSYLVLPPKSLNILQEIVEEHHRSDVLAANGLKPKQRALFYGPPGCGKTLAARVMAGVLSYPLITVRFDAVVSSYLGETAANLRRVFEYIQRGRWVVLFDEFDAIGKDRDNPFEHGELKRVVNTLLQQMDMFRGESLLIAATNHEKLLDSAIWRRFDVIVEFPQPAEQDRLLMLQLFLRGFDSSQIEFKTIARRTKGDSGADLELIAIESARHAILNNRSSLNKEDIDHAFNILNDRLNLARKLGINTINNKKRKKR